LETYVTSEILLSHATYSAHKTRSFKTISVQPLLYAYVTNADKVKNPEHFLNRWNDTLYYEYVT
jgi:hypothetical protein